jgi:hypothetical protein
MSGNPSSNEDKVRSFWDRYINKVNESGVQPPVYRWMAVRAERYIAAHPDQPVSRPDPVAGRCPPRGAGARLQDQGLAVAPGSRCYIDAVRPGQRGLAGSGGLAALARLGLRAGRGPSDGGAGLWSDPGRDRAWPPAVRGIERSRIQVSATGRRSVGYRRSGRATTLHTA